MLGLNHLAIVIFPVFSHFRDSIFLLGVRRLLHCFPQLARDLVPLFAPHLHPSARLRFQQSINVSYLLFLFFRFTARLQLGRCNFSIIFSLMSFALLRRLRQRQQQTEIDKLIKKVKSWIGKR